MGCFVQRVLLTAWLILIFVAGTVHALPTLCDRTCLEGVFDDYMNALAAHDHTRLPLASCVKYVENSQILQPGKGLWPIAGKPGKYRHIISDPQTKQVAAITTTTENGLPVIYVVRISLNDDGKISEVESQITRDRNGTARYEKLGTPEPLWLEPVPVEQRIPRSKLISQVDKYYSGMERNDPRGDYSFFDKECERLEDGKKTTNVKDSDPYGHSNDTTFASLGCEEQFQTGFLGFVTSIRQRRYPVVDEERQTVFAITIFDHNGTVRSLPSANGTSSPIPPYFDVPRTLPAMEAFRLRGEKIYRIEMTLTEAPYHMRSPFLEAPNLSHAGTDLTVPSNCQEECLGEVVLQVLAAMKAHNASQLPLAAGTEYMENGQVMGLDDGLWGTLSNYAIPQQDKYALTFSLFGYAESHDHSSGTYWGSIMEYDTPGVLALTVSVSDSKIRGISAMVVRAESMGFGGGTKTLLRPPLPLEWDGSDLGALDKTFGTKAYEDGHTNGTVEWLPGMYLDAIERHALPNQGTPVVAPNCARRDMGVQQNVSCAAQIEGAGFAPNGMHAFTGRAQTKWHQAEDLTKGISVMGAIFESTGATVGEGASEMLSVPGAYMTMSLFKVGDYGMERVESFVKWVPLGYTVQNAADILDVCPKK